MSERHNAAEWARKLEPLIAAEGLELVQAEVQGELLRVYIDRPEAAAEAAAPARVGIEDCERVSRTLSAAIPELGEWTLEVSSPGMDRPLAKPADFVRFAGRRVRVRSRAPIGGSRQFTGRLAGSDAAGVQVEVEGGEAVAVAWDNLAHARLAPLLPAPGRPGRRG